MTVGELMLKLAGYSRDHKVVLYDGEYASHIELTEVKEAVVHTIQNNRREIISHCKQRVVVL